MADLLVRPRPAESLQNGAGFCGKTYAYWACRKGKSGFKATKSAVCKDARAAFAKSKRNRAICPNHQIVRWGESKDEQEPHLDEIGGDLSESMVGRDWTPQ